MKIYAFLLFLCLGIYGCSGPIVRTDIKTFNADPGQFKGKSVIIQTTIEELNQNPELYYKKNVEVSGMVDINPVGLIDWYFDLVDDEGRKVVCYERTYRNVAWSYATTMVRRFDRTKETVTVEGRYQENRQIELNYIIFQGDRRIDTDYIPPSIRHRWYD